MEQQPNPTPKDSISALAFLVKNLVRPSGLKQLGFPSLLTGTGMAFPWLIIRSVSLANRNILEDMQMSLELAIANSKPYSAPKPEPPGVGHSSSKQLKVKEPDGNTVTCRRC